VKYLRQLSFFCFATDVSLLQMLLKRRFLTDTKCVRRAHAHGRSDRFHVGRFKGPDAPDYLCPVIACLQISTMSSLVRNPVETSFAGLNVPLSRVQFPSCITRHLIGIAGYVSVCMQLYCVGFHCLTTCFGLHGHLQVYRIFIFICLKDSVSLFFT
jgi:hypothetical protein